MDKHQAADILEGIVTLLEIRAEVVFRSRGCRDAAPALRGVSDEPSEPVETGRPPR